MKASGDQRDWFRYMHRLQAHTRATHEFITGRRVRRDMSSNFNWNQILVLGDYGAGKTTTAIKMAYLYYRLGHPVFSNASCLFGWHLEREEMYTALLFVPKNSVLLFDESSAHLSSRVGHGVAVSSFAESNLNTRKKNCIMIYMSAHDWEIAPAIRRNCREVWMPVSGDDLEIEAVSSTRGGKVLPANNPDNFRMAYHVWGDYPYLFAEHQHNHPQGEPGIPRRHRGRQRHIERRRQSSQASGIATQETHAATEGPVEGRTAG